MRILRLEAENVKKLRAVAIAPTGNVVQITGANGSGKSSVLDCIWMALAGKSAVPAQPVRQGEESARIVLDLGELVVTRRFTVEGSTSLTVTTADGAKYASPQTLLDGLLGALTFDPLAFSRMKPREQRDQLAEIAGLTAMLDELARADRADYDERTMVNRTLKQDEARLAAMPAVDDVQGVDVSATLAELRAAREANREAQALDDRRKQLREKAGATREVAERRREQARAMLAEADTFDAQAAALDASASVIMVPDLVDITPLEHRIEQAEATNAQKLAFVLRAEVAQDVANLRAESERLTAQLAAREAERRAVIEAAPLPLPGLGLTEDGVTLNGVPLAQASSAEQLRLAVAIAMATNPKLRVLRIQDGSLLDARSMAELERMADEHDFQVWIECVDTSGTVGIVMEDGTAREASAEESTPKRRRVAVGA